GGRSRAVSLGGPGTLASCTSTWRRTGQRPASEPPSRDRSRGSSARSSGSSRTTCSGCAGGRTSSRPQRTWVRRPRSRRRGLTVPERKSGPEARRLPDGSLAEDLVLLLLAAALLLVPAFLRQAPAGPAREEAVR